MVNVCKSHREGSRSCDQCVALMEGGCQRMGGSVGQVLEGFMVIFFPSYVCSGWEIMVMRCLMGRYGVRGHLL